MVYLSLYEAEGYLCCSLLSFLRVSTNGGSFVTVYTTTLDKSPLLHTPEPQPTPVSGCFKPDNQPT